MRIAFERAAVHEDLPIREIVAQNHDNGRRLQDASPAVTWFGSAGQTSITRPVPVISFLPSTGQVLRPG